MAFLWHIFSSVHLSTVHLKISQFPRGSWTYKVTALFKRSDQLFHRHVPFLAMAVRNSFLFPLHCTNTPLQVDLWHVESAGRAHNPNSKSKSKSVAARFPGWFLFQKILLVFCCCCCCFHVRQVIRKKSSGQQHEKEQKTEQRVRFSVYGWESNPWGLRCALWRNSFPSQLGKGKRTRDTAK